MQADTARLSVSDRDQKGIIAGLSGLLAGLGANIVASHPSPPGGSP
jgi:predicted amino acid-binding ACT domain protein